MELTVDTSELVAGDIVMIEETSVLIEGGCTTWGGFQGRTVYHWNGRIIAGPHPLGWDLARNRDWDIQGNDLAMWDVRRG